jgi:serine/threonine protein kinase
MIISSLPGEDSTTQYSKITFFNKGGMGEIYKAWDDTNKKDVAIKLIAILDSADEELLSREIDISSKLISENIVKTNYTGKTDISGVSYFYIVQDFYDNGNLRGAIRSGIPLDECFAMMNDILTGLQAAHSKIIHRDLKPENILIDASGKLVITDFGLAKYIGEKTKTKSFKGGGTIPYMAPECWLLDTNSISMDIYSLGIMFYELLTGKLPINSKSETDWRDFHVYQSLPDISVLRADVSIKLKQIISKMTQKRVQDRYKNTAEIVAALNEVVEQNVQDRKEAERLARIGHSTVMHIQATKLKERQEEDRINEYKKMLNYHIIELFDKLKDIINSVNSSMELEKINIEEHPFNGDLTKRGITISFNDKKISFRFYHHDVIQR